MGPCPRKNSNSFLLLQFLLQMLPCMQLHQNLLAYKKICTTLLIQKIFLLNHQHLGKSLVFLNFLRGHKISFMLCLQPQIINNSLALACQSYFARCANQTFINKTLCGSSLLCLYTCAHAYLCFKRYKDCDTTCNYKMKQDFIDSTNLNIIVFNFHIISTYGYSASAATVDIFAKQS